MGILGQILLISDFSRKCRVRDCRHTNALNLDERLPDAHFS